nr:MAG: replication initiator protein [Microviridae sp.]
MYDNDILMQYSQYRRERARVRDWTYRVYYESCSHEQNCCLTLTYNPENLPVGGELSLRDFQLFMKRLRKRLSPQKVRYFGCGEYGKLGSRPHYHVIVFGFCPDDLVYSHTDDHGIKFYRSKFISDVWGKGFIVVCRDISPSTIPYVCKYMQKFNDCNSKKAKPFILMSRRPGIGFCGFSNDLIDFEHDNMYMRGKRRKIARYYLEKAKSINDDVANALNKRRDGGHLCVDGLKFTRRISAEKFRGSDKAVDAEIEKYYSNVKKMQDFFKKG